MTDKIKWLEESVLSYAARQKLPSGAFCGPDRSYPAHDLKRARNCLARAAQQLKKGNLSRAQYGKIRACCARRLKRLGGKPAEETVPDSNVIQWLKTERGVS